MILVTHEMIVSLIGCVVVTLFSWWLFSRKSGK